MTLRNPKILGPKSLRTLIGDINREDPAEYEVVGDKEVPEWQGFEKHFQGIAPKNGVVEITGHISASADEWWVASFVEDGDPAHVKAVWGTEYYDHAGGIQRLGDLLPIGLENEKGEATVAFYDVTDPSAEPAIPLYEVHIAGKASAVAITDYKYNGVDYAMLLVYQYSPKKFHAFRALRDDIGGNSNNWHHMGETNELPDADDDDQYQCFALATQDGGTSNDTVHLLGFRENEAVVLYNVKIDGEPHEYGNLEFVEAFNDWEGGVEFRYAIGLQICGPQHIRIFGSSEDPSGDTNDYRFPIYYWG